eukprot:TRINITY_DN7135_c0_g1_i1.p1 TRINITY_DN7135_c0_g1~~TRINITY_DN7135_c0_g1_i1.p1  ORF type:complete len:851 (-),score=187.96 TRINITY_DN7135_c0_g1_i1:188-2740(-)
MKILLVDCFNPDPRGRKQLSQFQKRIKESFKSQFRGLGKLDLIVARSGELEPYIFDAQSKFVDERALSRFDNLEIIFFGMELSEIPWSNAMLPVLILIRMCVLCSKVCFGTGAFSEFLTYSLQVTRNVNVSAKIHSFLAEKERIPSGIREDDILYDEKTGDLFLFADDEMWKSFTNTGFTRIETPKVETLTLQVTQFGHYVARNLPPQFEVPCRCSYMVAPKNIGDNKLKFLGKNPLGPLIIEFGHCLATQFLINSQYPETEQILDNFIFEKVMIMLQCGNVQVTAQSLLHTSALDRAPELAILPFDSLALPISCIEISAISRKSSISRRRLPSMTEKSVGRASTKSSVPPIKLPIPPSPVRNNVRSVYSQRRASSTMEPSTATFTPTLAPNSGTLASVNRSSVYGGVNHRDRSVSMVGTSKKDNYNIHRRGTSEATRYSNGGRMALDFGLRGTTETPAQSVDYGNINGRTESRLRSGSAIKLMKSIDTGRYSVRSVSSSRSLAPPAALKMDWSLATSRVPSYNSGSVTDRGHIGTAGSTISQLPSHQLPSSRQVLTPLNNDNNKDILCSDDPFSGDEGDDDDSDDHRRDHGYLPPAINPSLHHQNHYNISINDSDINRPAILSHLSPRNTRRKRTVTVSHNDTTRFSVSTTNTNTMNTHNHHGDGIPPVFPSSGLVPSIIEVDEHSSEGEDDDDDGSVSNRLTRMLEDSGIHVNGRPPQAPKTPPKRVIVQQKRKKFPSPKFHKNGLSRVNTTKAFPSHTGKAPNFFSVVCDGPYMSETDRLRMEESSSKKKWITSNGFRSTFGKASTGLKPAPPCIRTSGPYVEEKSRFTVSETEKKQWTGDKRGFQL